MMPEYVELTVRRVTADVVDASSIRVSGEEVIDADRNLKNVNIIVYTGA